MKLLCYFSYRDNVAIGEKIVMWTFERLPIEPVPTSLQECLVLLNAGKQKSEDNTFGSNAVSLHG
jgi:hypothetical protein